MAADVDLSSQTLNCYNRRTVHLTDLGHAIVEHILPRKRKRSKTPGRKNATNELERVRKQQIEIERALWQPGHWRNKTVDFIRPDGSTETKDVGWCVDNNFKKVKNGKPRDTWAGNWATNKTVGTLTNTSKSSTCSEHNNPRTLMANERILHDTQAAAAAAARTDEGPLTRDDIAS